MGREECLESYICRDRDVLTRKRVGKHEGMKELYYIKTHYTFIVCVYNSHNILVDNLEKKTIKNKP